MFKLGIKKFSPFPARPCNEIVGVEFDDTSLSLVHAIGHAHKIEVAGLFSQSIANLNDNDISTMLRSSFNELKAKDPIVMAVMPSHLAITKNIEIPSCDPGEIREIINLQAGRHTPYSREEIIVDYIEIGTFRKSYTKILLVIVSRAVVKRHCEIIEKAGLKLEKVLFVPEGLAWYVFRILKLESEEAPASVLHIGEVFTDFMIISKNRPFFLRSIPIGAQQLAGERDKYLVKFAEEVKKSFEAYQAEDIERPPDRIIITGALEEINNPQELLNDMLPFPIRVVPYCNSMLISAKALNVARSAKRLSFLGAIASIVAWDELKVDLLPDEIKLRKALQERGSDLIKTGIFVLLSFVLVFSILISKIYFKGIYLKRINEKYQPLGLQVKELEKHMTRSSMIKYYLDNRGYALEVLAELYITVSQEVELSDIRFDNEGKLSLKGIAESMSSVFSFVDNLEKSRYFKEVKTKYTAKRKDGTRDVTDFEIAALLEK